MKAKKYLDAAFAICAALFAIFCMGFISYKLIGAAGAFGVIIIVAAILINGFIIKVEDEQDDLSNRIAPPKDDAERK